MKVKFVGSSIEQVKWGGNDDPSGLLTEGEEYELIKEEVHSWHTKYVLAILPDKKFNSSSFEPARVSEGWNEYDTMKAKG